MDESDNTHILIHTDSSPVLDQFSLWGSSEGHRDRKYESPKLLINLSRVQLLPLTVWTDSAGGSRRVVTECCSMKAGGKSTSVSCVHVLQSGFQLEDAH